MNPTDPNFESLLETRLARMRVLADSLEAAQQALAANDVDAFERKTAEQIALCRELQQVEEKLQAEHGRLDATAPLFASMSSNAADPTASLRAQSRAVEERLRALNRVHGALLRRSAHSLRILVNVLSASAPAYSPPASPISESLDKPCQI